MAQVTGTGIGTIFRYWAYKKWVFPPARLPAPGPRAGLPASPLTSGRDATGTWPVAEPELPRALVERERERERVAVFTRVR